MAIYLCVSSLPCIHNGLWWFALNVKWVFTGWNIYIYALTNREIFIQPMYIHIF